MGQPPTRIPLTSIKSRVLEAPDVALATRLGNRARMPPYSPRSCKVGQSQHEKSPTNGRPRRIRSETMIFILFIIMVIIML